MDAPYPGRSMWWRDAVVYQIYPRSFQDSDGDGIGDLRGIAQRLDHLVCLGVDAFWLSPIYPSPLADFGYDVSDYTNVDPVFGSLEDLDALVQEAVRFWLGRGIDGFRVDALTAIVKDAELRDDPPATGVFTLPSTGEFGELEHVYSSNRPEAVETLAALREAAGDALLIGEVF